MKHPKTALATAAGIFIWAFQGLGTKFVPDDLLTNIFTNSDSTEVQKIAVVQPYAEPSFTPLPSRKKPILDGNLYLYKNYGSLVIGGVNFSQLKMASRTEEGDIVEVKSKTENSISLAVYEVPYVELGYKGKYYEIVLDPEYFVGPDDKINFSYMIREIAEPTMLLKVASSI
ncbi:hypothetical protein ACSVUT_005177 [Vibrio harveyi]